MVGKDLIMATLLGSGGGSSGSGGGGGGWPEVPNDGATYLYITLAEGRTSPMLGVGVNGTVTVDWGDGTEPDVLTGTNAAPAYVKWTQNHEYAAPGNYVIRLTVDGFMSICGDSTERKRAYILRQSKDADSRNKTYQKSLKRVKIGDNRTSIGNYAFYDCHDIESVEIPEGVTEIGSYAFNSCYSITSVKIPSSVSQISAYAFQNCCGAICYDFTDCTAVPNINSGGVFSNIPADCEIRVPAALYDEWIAATNWATYADYIKAY